MSKARQWKDPRGIWTWAFRGIALSLLLAGTVAAGSESQPDHDRGRGHVWTLRELCGIGGHRDSLLQGLSVPMLPNARGDLTADSLLNVLDLLRLRDIIRGFGDPPSPHELTAGDITVDGQLTAADLDSFPPLVTQQHGPPHVMTTSGGQVHGAGVTLSFAAGEVDSGTVMRIDPRSAEDIEAASGIEFSSLEEDSTYFMTGFKLEGSNDGYVYPPSGEVYLQELPPCQLEGSNLLMVARRGPAGDTELIYVAQLDSVGDSVLSIPPPPYPTVGAPGRGRQPDLRTEQFYRPFDLMYLPATEYSEALAGNAVLFSMPGGTEWPMTPIAYYPATAAGWHEIEGLIVPVAPLLPGPANVRLLHVGTGLSSQPIQIEILPLNDPAAVEPDSVLMGARDLLGELLERTIAYVQEDSLLPEYAREFIADRYAIGSLIQEYYDTILSIPELEGLRRQLAAVIENQEALAVIETAIAILSGGPPPGDEWDMYEFQVARGAILLGLSAIEVLGNPIQWTTRSGRPDSVNVPCEVGVLIADSGLVEPLPVLARAADYLDRAVVLACGFRPAEAPVCARGGRGVGGRDGSYDPRPYPGHCMNIWKHNTNAAGAASNNQPCPPNDPCCGDEVPPRGPGIGGRSDWREGDVPRVHTSVLTDAIITPTSGGIAGIAAIVDGAGAFALPGLSPGHEVHFSLYDPHRGFFRVDAGYAVTPNVAEQGAWFHVFLVVEEEASTARIYLELGEYQTREINELTPRYEFGVVVSEAHVGSVVDFGFRSAESLTFWFQDPSGQYIVHESATRCENIVQFELGATGIYLLTVTYGETGGDGPFTVGVNVPPYPATPYLCGTVTADSLYLEYAPYYVANPATISSGHTVGVAPGVRINFETGGVLTCTGTLHGDASAEAPIVLSPSGALRREPDTAELTGRGGKVQAGGAR